MSEAEFVRTADRSPRTESLDREATETAFARREESTLEGWLLDLVGLAAGTIVGTGVVAAVLDVAVTHLLPEARDAIPLSPAAGFVLGFVVLDYLQYWVHRLFHEGAWFRLHLLHHTLVEMRARGAFRHSFAECLLSPAYWFHGLVLVVVADPRAYAVAVSTGLVLDAYRHSTLVTASGTTARWLASVLVTPEDHAMHHRLGSSGTNFGGNLKLWDRLHGTYAPPDHDARARYGVPNADSAWRLLLAWARPVRTSDSAR